MNIAIICNKGHMYQSIRDGLVKETGTMHYYRTVHDFKNSEMIPYGQLILYTYILDSLDAKTIYELQRYCDHNQVEVFTYHLEKKEKNQIDFASLLHESRCDVTTETVELKPLLLLDDKSSSQIEVIKTVYKNIPQKNVGILNLSEKAGSTFVAVNLAKELSNHNVTVTYIETPFKRPYAFDYLGLPNKLEEYDKDYQDYLYVGDLLDPKILDHREKKILQEDNISWLVLNPLEKYNPTENYNFSDFIHQCRFSSVNLIDIGKVEKISHLHEMLVKLDFLILIIDPMPSEILQNEKMLLYLKKNRINNRNLIMLVNKFNKHVKIKELKEYLDFNPVITVSHVDISYIYQAVYNYKIPIDIKECKKEISEDMQKIMKLILPKEVPTKARSRINIRSHLMRWKSEKFDKK